MGCTHPPVFVKRITREDGIPGLKCVSCGTTAYKGESFWTQIKRNWFSWR